MMAVLACMTVWGQDTTDSYLRPGYFYNYLPETDKCDFLPGLIPSAGNFCGANTKEMYASEMDSLTIYGVAAVMLTQLDLTRVPENASQVWWEEFFEEYGDTSTADLFEFLGVYLRDADSITVTDTFYMGTTQRTVGHIRPRENISFGMMMLGGSPSRVSFHEYHVTKFCSPTNTHWYWPDRLPMGAEYFMIFPILTPDPSNPGDTVGGNPGDSTLTVTESDMVSRYVSVQPNPALDEAQVLRPPSTSPPGPPPPTCSASPPPWAR